MDPAHSASSKIESPSDTQLWNDFKKQSLDAANQAMQEARRYKPLAKDSIKSETHCRTFHDPVTTIQEAMEKARQENARKKEAVLRAKQDKVRIQKIRQKEEAQRARARASQTKPRKKVTKQENSEWIAAWEKRNQPEEVAARASAKAEATTTNLLNLLKAALNQEYTTQEREAAYKAVRKRIG